MARYRAWAGDTEEARRILEALVRAGEATTEDLVLLADVLRWDGEWMAADRRYGDALAREAAHPGALAGRRALEEAVRARVADRDPEGAGVLTDVYADSDDFRRWSVQGRTVLGPGTLGLATQRVEVRAGVQLLEGPTLAGGEETQVGPVGEVRWIKWWRQAGLRTFVGAGVEQLDATGTEPRITAGLEIPGAGFSAGYRHGLAHPTTLTFETVQDQTRLDGAWASLFRSWADGAWAAYGRVEGASLRDDAVENGRFVGQGELERRFGPSDLFRAGYSTRLLTTTEPAPVSPGGRSSYWSPALSWSHGLTLGLGDDRSGEGWGWNVQVRPGVSAIRLHGADAGTEWELRLSGRAGLEYRDDDWSLRLSSTYLRSRLDGYEAAGARIELLRRF
jgi:hypothetical protein